MNKTIIAGVILLLLGGGAVAGMTVADNKIEALYAQDELGPLQNLTTSQTDLGFMGGSVNWKADLVLDPCEPNAKVTLVGSDTIRKGLTGYTIDSEIKPTFDSAEAMALMDKMPALQTTTHVNWLGGGSSEFVYPADALSQDGATLSWETMTGDFDFDKKGDNIVVDDVEVLIPSASLGYDTISAQLSDVSYTSDAPMGYQVLESGNAKMAIGGLDINDADQGHVTLKDIVVSIDQKVNADTVDVSLVYEIGLIEGATNGEVVAIDDSVARIDFKGISRPAVESMMQVFDRASKECVPQQVIVKEVEAPMLQALQAGMSVESKGNQIKVGEGIITADATLNMPAYPYVDLENALQTMPTQVSYDATLEFDKAFVKGVGDIGAGSNPMMSGSVEDDWQTIVAMTGAEVQGDRAVIKVSSE